MFVSTNSLAMLGDSVRGFCLAFSFRMTLPPTSRTNGKFSAYMYTILSIYSENKGVVTEWSLSIRSMVRRN